MRIISNVEAVKKYNQVGIEFIQIDNIRDLQTCLKNVFHPLIILTESFNELDSLLIDYSRRKKTYELVILSKSTKGNQCRKNFENDLLSLLNAPIDKSAIELVIERYKFRRKLFLKNKVEKLYIELSHEKIILIDDIKFIRAYGNYTLIFMPNERIIERIPFSSIAKKLPAEEFIQTHRSFIVNIQKVTEIKQCSLRIDDDTIPISTRKKCAVLKLFQAENKVISLRSSQNSYQPNHISINS